MVVHPEGLGGRHGRGFIDHERAGFFPELIVGGAHPLNDFGVLRGDISFLAGVFGHVEELLSDKAVLVIANGELLPLVLVGFGSGGPAGDLGEEVAVGPR